MPAYRNKKSAEVLEKEIEQEKELCSASAAGNIEKVKKLLDEDVSPDATEFNRSQFYASKNYLTPTMEACKCGHDPVVKLLIEKGADVNLRDRYDVTALHLAAEFGHHECVKLLLEASAEVNVETKYSKCGFYHAPYPGGTTALHLAAKNNHVECIIELIWYGADYNAVDEYGETSLYIAAHSGHSEGVMAHLDNAIRTDILSLPVKDTEDTPLHECVKHALAGCVNALLERGSDVNHRDASGQSPLHIACHSRDAFSMDILRNIVLKGYNVDINLPDSKGYTPLHYVTCGEGSYQERRPEPAIFLIALGANFDIKTKGEPLLFNELRLPRQSSIEIVEAIVACCPELPKEENLPTHLTQSGSAQHTQALEMSNWYRNICSNPRSLQALCRIVIRTAITPTRLPKVGTLPIPVTLKEYLLLDQVSFSTRP